jgi:nucleoside-diphosphate-sugar epimerase
MGRTALVTGGRGRSGRWIVDRLARDGWSVVCVDREHPGWEVPQRPNVDFRVADLTDRGEAFELVGEVDPTAVVHWAALPSPERHAGGSVFEHNVAATYNALVAAGQVGARVVQASSESIYGFPFAERPSLPDALPITEQHAARPEDPYGTSKVVGEELAAMVTRRYDVPVVSIRSSWIQYPGAYNCLANQDDLAAGVGNFWSYVDVRDVASLVAIAIEAEFDTHEVFHAAAADNYMDQPTTDLVEAYFDDLPATCSLDGDQAALSTAKARELLGWEPDHSWREAAGESVEAPSLTA